MEWLVGGRPGALLLKLDTNAGEVGGAALDVRQDYRRRWSFVPVLKVQLDPSDDILRPFSPGLIAPPYRRVHRVGNVHRQNDRLNLTRQRILLNQGKVATGMNHDQGAGSFNPGEELDLLTMLN